MPQRGPGRAPGKGIRGFAAEAETPFAGTEELANLSLSVFFAKQKSDVNWRKKPWPLARMIRQRTARQPLPCVALVATALTLLTALTAIPQLL